MNSLNLNKRVSRLAVKGVAVTSFEVRCLPLDDLHMPVRDVPAFADEVADSIAKRGLDNPVIVVRGPREDLIKEIVECGGNADSMPDSPVVNCVFGGTNRITAARRLGYGQIDCILLPTFELAIKLQGLQRASYDATKRKAGNEAGV
jgi:hypothetical protein